MPYPTYSGRRVPTTREVSRVEFKHADGQVETHSENAKVVGASPDADLDALVTTHKIELGCGCFYPEAHVAGVCAECVRQKLAANLCKMHFLVCECGEPCCWKHSRLTQDRTRSLCSRCHLREKNKTMFRAVLVTLRRLGRAIFYTK